MLELELILLEDAHEGIRTVRVVLDDQDLDIWVFRGVQLALQSVLVGQAKLASARVHHTFDKFADRCAFVIEVVVEVAVKTVIWGVIVDPGLLLDVLYSSHKCLVVGLLQYRTSPSSLFLLLIISYLAFEEAHLRQVFQVKAIVLSLAILRLRDIFGKIIYLIMIRRHVSLIYLYRSNEWLLCQYWVLKVSSVALHVLIVDIWKVSRVIGWSSICFFGLL